MADDYAADLELALRLADIADAISLPRFGALDLRVDTKPDLTPVTDADRAVEQALRDALTEHRPADAIIGEEFGGKDDRGGGAEAARCWVVDPIDATKNFVRGVPVWATLIGLLRGRDSVVGVVSAPALGYRWWGAAGLGSWTAAPGAPARRNAVSVVANIGDASLSYSDLNDWGTRSDGFSSLVSAAWRTRAYGDFWSHMLVAEGCVDISTEPEVSIWDVAALVPIVVEAGGRVTGIDGAASPHAPSIVCSNNILHDQVLHRLGG
jgi:histidinol-phosphatase